MRIPCGARACASRRRLRVAAGCRVTALAVAVGRDHPDTAGDARLDAAASAAHSR